MKKLKTAHLGLAFCGLLAFTLPVLAQAPRASTATRHSLWKIEGTKSTVYLMGSVHVLKPENYPLPAPLESAFTNSQIVAFETDLGEMEKGETQMKVLAKAKLPEGETLENQLSPEVYAQFTKHLDSAGLPAMVFSQFKPSMAAIMLVVLELQKMGLSTEQGLDKHFFTLAQKQGKQIVGLETLDFQISLVTDFTKAEGEALMRSTLKDLDQLKSTIGDMLTAWETGDSEKLEKLLNEFVKEEPAIYKRLLTDRNKSWIPKIEEFSRGDKNAVVIVGAGHLVGKEGVVELLKKKGLKVTQM
jgi:uncharacterized protein YbaP (TraB family)